MLNHIRRTGAVWSVAALALCAGAAFARPAAPKKPARPAAPKSIAQSVMPMLNTIAAAANKGEAYKTWPYATSGRGEVFSWVRDAGMLSKLMQPDPWKAAVLEPPFTNGPGPLAVFHTWHAPESDGDHIHPLVRTPKGYRVAPEISERDTQGYRIRHHALDVTINPEKRTAAVQDMVTLERGTNAKPVVFLRLSSDFTVRSISANRKAVPYRQAGGVVAVRVPAGKSVDLFMKYDGRVVHKQFNSIEPNYAILNAYYWPSLGRLPATATTNITVPPGWTAVTQGNLLGREHFPGKSLWHWVNDIPVNYFSLAAAKYQVTTRQVGDVTLATYLLNAQPGFADTVLDTLEMALPYFEKRFGPFPYKRYSVMDGGQVMGFVALEGYSMATYGTVTLTPMVVAHELAHTWWGGVVPNTYLRSWWNEAFASYSDDAYSRMKNKVAERHPTDRPWWPAHASIASAPLSTAREKANIDAIAYRKGMVVLRLLEEQVGGEEPFDRILQTFVRENSGKADPGWPDFQRTVEKVTGKDWQWFFEQWVSRPGWPELSLVDVKMTEGPGGYVVTGQIEQVGEPYRLDVRLRLAVEGGETKELVVPITKASGRFRFETPARPEKLMLEPDMDIPRRFGVMDVATFDATGRVTYTHSREERPSMMF